MSNKHNSADAPTEQYYETPYSLLDTISPLYRAQFCQTLAAKLEALNNQQND